MKLRSKTEKQKANNRKIQREREQKHCGFEISFPLPSCLITQISSQINKNKKQNRIEQNMKLKLTDNSVEPEDGGRSV